MGRPSDRIEIFSGWKEIADYLGKGVRTVQRYERKLGLPVRRPAQKAGGAVIATRVELDAWIATPRPATLRLTKPGRIALSSLKELKSNIEQLRQFRLECQRLRSEMHYSVELLRQSILAPLYAPHSPVAEWIDLRSKKSQLEDRFRDEPSSWQGRSWG